MSARRAGDALAVVRTLAELGDDVALAPERACVAELAGTTGPTGSGTPLGELVQERSERIEGAALGDAIVLDTTHVKDGLVDVAAAARGGAPSSAKKLARAGDLLVSRLRPYLRQIGLVTRDVAGTLACSTEFHVLAPRGKEGLAYLLPWLLSDATQAMLAAAQEGGHHPRVPRATLLALRVPHAVIARRVASSREVEGALAEVYAAQAKLRRALTRAP